MEEMGYGRSDYDSSSRLGDWRDVVDGGGNGVEPALKLFGEGWPIVCIPGAGVAGFSSRHRTEGLWI